MNGLDVLANECAKAVGVRKIKPRRIMKDSVDPSLIAKVSSFDTEKRTWGKARNMYGYIPSNKRINFLCDNPIRSIAGTKPTLQIRLARGGTIKIWRNIVQEETLQLIKQEMLSDIKFRRYKIQGGYEPRVHCLYHRLASDDENAAQPGYKYGQITLKSSPLSDLPFIEILADVMAELCNVYDWRLGVNPICYRSGGDRIGKHADNDQGESTISTVIVDGPRDRPRQLVVEPHSRIKREDYTSSDDKIQIFLRPGDVYQMDQAMQKNYVHYVPKTEDPENDDDNKNVEQQSRLAIVFRDGTYTKFHRDNGEPVYDLRPDPKLSYRFGAIKGLNYGAVNKRTKLISMGAHLGIQKSISGSRVSGCDALIMAGTRKDSLEWDCIFQFVYAVEAARGAHALLDSFRKKRLVRVFRSSKIDDSISKGKEKSQYYRYDGLYVIMSVKTPMDSKEPYLFFLAMAHLNIDGANNVLDESNSSKCLKTIPTTLENIVPDKPLRLGRADRFNLSEFQVLFDEAKTRCIDKEDIVSVYEQLLVDDLSHLQVAPNQAWNSLVFLLQRPSVSSNPLDYLGETARELEKLHKPHNSKRCHLVYKAGLELQHFETTPTHGSRRQIPDGKKATKNPETRAKNLLSSQNSVMQENYTYAQQILDDRRKLEAQGQAFSQLKLVLAEGKQRRLHLIRMQHLILENERAQKSSNISRLAEQRAAALTGSYLQSYKALSAKIRKFRTAKLKSTTRKVATYGMETQLQSQQERPQKEIIAETKPDTSRAQRRSYKTRPRREAAAYASPAVENIRDVNFVSPRRPVRAAKQKAEVAIKSFSPPRRSCSRATDIADIYRLRKRCYDDSKQVEDRIRLASATCRRRATDMVTKISKRSTKETSKTAIPIKKSRPRVKAFAQLRIQPRATKGRPEALLIPVPRNTRRSLRQKKDTNFFRPSLQ